MSDTDATIATLQAELEDLKTSIDVFFVLIMGIICFLLQAGFGLLEVGSIRAKNAQNIMLKNVLDVAVCAVAYYAIGYSIAYGKCSVVCFEVQGVEVQVSGSPALPLYRQCIYITNSFF
jgi:ammonia channel protein AmtB